jgi:uncharacterized protein YhbP (UPF0306 family)
MGMEELTAFLQQQTILQIAPQGDTPWIANVLMVSQTPETIYFIGSERTHYGQRLAAGMPVAFATAWHASDDHADRKGIQGVGIAEPVHDELKIAEVVGWHNAAYPAFREQITPTWVLQNEFATHVWALRPNFIKFWNDALYGRDGTATFTFTE